MLKAHPCEMCVLIVKDMLNLAEHQGMLFEEKWYICEASSKQFWLSLELHQKEHNGEGMWMRPPL
jgi:hypothetical protein